jgi:uncharacterized surface protein with fasciclin (FAS1) repeats
MELSLFVGLLIRHAFASGPCAAQKLFLIRHSARRVSENTIRAGLETFEVHGVRGKSMKRIQLLGVSALIALCAVTGSAFAADPMVGGAAMSPMKNIVENAMNSQDHTTLVAAVKSGGLVDTLEGQGPFTVFAPTNEAFAALPTGTVETLLKPENKGTLDKVLTYHVVPGRLDTMTLDKMIKDGGGKAMLKTVEGDTLTVTGHGHQLSVTDSKGDIAMITIANVYQSNGVILVVDKVLMPG